MPKFNVEVLYRDLSGNDRNAVYVLSAKDADDAREIAAERCRNDRRRNVYAVEYIRCYGVD